MAKAKARTASVKGPPPLPTVDQERPTPRPPALATERRTSRPAAIDEPPPTPRAPPVSARLESVDDEDEHTVMRPAKAPLPRDAFRDDSASASQPRASDAEPSVGVPLELPVQAPSPRKPRAGFVWMALATAALGGGALVLAQQRQSPTLANSAAPVAAPKSFTRPLPAPSPGRPRDDGTLDPPISTSFEDNEAAPEEATVGAPSGVRRRPRPATARPPQAARAAAPAAAEPNAPPSPSGTAPADGNTLVEPARAAATEPKTATPAPSAAAPTSPATAVAPTVEGTAGAAAHAPVKDVLPQGTPQGNVDTENPYGD